MFGFTNPFIKAVKYFSIRQLAYVELLQRNHIQISMTQSGSPYDNAIPERDQLVN
ncbi:hypothetical protein LZQ00_06720 [Sphingobacterium sp. SRCM116780]|uniref:hypothetical protein n=1 Tax=Sphingobacterium sp. SRCM116780 TaxID=2907623 RepID=UPI001F19C47C|nr:hypothetical protein [Sphingobacterium sp. SRCM116780]UIR57506.1 hypothetical protein LZQ00_06720 [Sphingobacterium sp. SRCM116780]